MKYKDISKDERINKFIELLEEEVEFLPKNFIKEELTEMIEDIRSSQNQEISVDSNVSDLSPISKKEYQDFDVELDFQNDPNDKYIFLEFQNIDEEIGEEIDSVYGDEILKLREDIDKRIVFEDEPDFDLRYSFDVSMITEEQQKELLKKLRDYTKSNNFNLTDYSIKETPRISNMSYSELVNKLKEDYDLKNGEHFFQREMLDVERLVYLDKDKEEVVLAKYLEGDTKNFVRSEEDLEEHITNMIQQQEDRNFEIMNLRKVRYDEPFKILENSKQTREYLRFYEDLYIQDNNVKEKYLELRSIRDRLSPYIRDYSKRPFDWQSIDDFQDMRVFEMMYDQVKNNQHINIDSEDEQKIDNYKNSFTQEQEELFDLSKNYNDVVFNHYMLIEEDKLSHLNNFRVWEREEVINEVDEKLTNRFKNELRLNFREYQNDHEKFMEFRDKNMRIIKKELHLKEDLEYPDLMEELDEYYYKDKYITQEQEYLSLQRNWDKDSDEDWLLQSNEKFIEYLDSELKDTEYYYEIEKDKMFFDGLTVNGNDMGAIEVEKLVNENFKNFKNPNFEKIRDYENSDFDNYTNKEEILDFLKLNKEKISTDIDYVSQKVLHILTESDLFYKYENDFKSAEKLTSEDKLEGWSWKMFHYKEYDNEDIENWKEWVDTVIQKEEYELNLKQEISNRKQYLEDTPPRPGMREYEMELEQLEEEYHSLTSKKTEKQMREELENEKYREQEVLKSIREEEIEKQEIIQDIRQNINIEDRRSVIEFIKLNRDKLVEDYDFTSEIFNELLTDSGLFHEYEEENKSYEKYKDTDGWSNALFHYFDSDSEDKQNFEEWIDFVVDSEELKFRYEEDFKNENNQKEEIKMKRENIREILKSKGLSIDGFETSGLSREEYLEKNFENSYSNENVFKSVKVRTLKKLEEYVEVSGFEPIKIEKEIEKKDFKKNYSQIATNEYLKNFDNDRLESVIKTKMVADKYRDGNIIYLDNQRRYKGKELLGIKTKQELKDMGLTLNDTNTPFTVIERKKMYELETDNEGKYIRENDDWKYKLDENGKKILKETKFYEKKVYDLSDTNYEHKQEDKISKTQVTKDLVESIKIELSQNFNTKINHQPMGEKFYSKYENGELTINEKHEPSKQLEDMIRLFGNTRGLNKDQRKVFQYMVLEKLGIEQEGLNIDTENLSKEDKINMTKKSFNIYNQVTNKIDFDMVKKIELENQISNDEVVAKEYDITNDTLKDIQKKKRKSSLERIQNKLDSSDIDKEQENQSEIDFESDNDYNPNR